MKTIPGCDGWKVAEDMVVNTVPEGKFEFVEQQIYVELVDEHGENSVQVGMDEDFARDLRDQMKEFWQLDGVHQNDEPTGDSPFAKIYKELSRVLEGK